MKKGQSSSICALHREDASKLRWKLVCPIILTCSKNTVCAFLRTGYQLTRSTNGLHSTEQYFSSLLLFSPIWRFRSVARLDRGFAGGFICIPEEWSTHTLQTNSICRSTISVYSTGMLIEFSFKKVKQVGETMPLGWMTHR